MNSFLDSLSGLWFRMLDVQPNPRPWILLGTAVAGLIAVGHHALWRVLRNVVTTAHEGGHALVALCVGRKLSRIELHSDTSGVTVSRGKPHGPGMVATMLAGYLAPSLTGLGAALLLAGGYITGMLVLTVLLLLVLLSRVRNAHGVLSVLITGGVVLAVAWLAPAQAQAVFAYVFAWFLLFGGVRPVFELAGQRRHGRAWESDADQLARLTGVAGGVWVSAFGLVNLAVLAAGVGVLVPRVIAGIESLRTAAGF
ncbi:MAG: M50 family metallopeptidase [Sciscionella sp.]